MHDVSDSRNASILINVNGEMKPRVEAVVSVFDSGFVLGDGVREGPRVHNGRIAFLDRHLDRPRLPDEARHLAGRCQPYYERLALHRISPLG